jgi:3-deoxy-manno-octulosonate cytidylyltransferase (CMP-KDO synthetase)
VNKPRGMVVHPAPGHPDGTLVNALLAHCAHSLSGTGGETRPGIVHRIDRDTSGLIIAAKNDLAHRRLAAQLADHSMFRIYEAVVSFGGRVVMTRSDHKSGTDRIQEAVEKINTDADVIINVQGDEPFIQPIQIKTLMQLFDAPETQIGTLGKRFDSMEAVENPNSPKIVTDARGFALYFSRSVIPFVRGKERGEWLSSYPFLKHLGIYAYRREVLAEVTKLPQSSLEKAESLEQLRWLENGYRIRVGLTDVETVGIDTPEDLVRAEQFL